MESSATQPQEGTSLRVKLAILTVFVGCSLNVIFLELLVKADTGCGNLVTFTSFLFISVEGFIFTSDFGRKTPKVPLRAYSTMVIMYFGVSVVNNWALSFDIPMPLHMIFRAGSLIANMIMGMLILGRRYTKIKYLAVLAISVGIGLCTIVSSRKPDKDTTMKVTPDLEEDSSKMLTFATGIFMLTFALFMSARMGIYQEVIYSKYGKHAKEALYYSHCLPLVGFVILYKDIYSHLLIAINSELIALPLLPMVTVPKLLLYLVGNTLTQYICISAVFILTTECASLTVTLVITLRKFASLLFSIWYFHNPFTPHHWIGTALVFAGTLVFSLKKDDTLQKTTVVSEDGMKKEIKTE